MYIFRRLSRPSSLIATTALALALIAGCKKPAAPPTDDALTTALHNRLAADSALSTEPPIQTTVQNGVATLNGSVSNDAARSLAAADAAQVPGIKTVVNNLTVQPPTPVAAAAPPAPAPVPEPAPRERRKPSASKEKAAPVVRQAPRPAQEAAAVPPPPAEGNMAAPVSRPAPPPAPAFRDVTVPSGTVVPVRVTQTLSSANAQIGDTFSGVVTSDVVAADGLTAIPAGTPVSGRVSDVQEAAHYKGNSLLSVQLTGVSPRGNQLSISSAPYTLQGKGRGKNTAEKVGGGAAIGAILGGIFGGGKGAAIGAAAGGGVGAGANTITRGEQVQIPSESIVRFRLNGPLSLRVPNNGSVSGDNGTPSTQLQRRSNN